MRKNVAGQHVAAQVNSRVDGSPITSGVSVFVTVDGGAQGAGGGTATHEGNGHWTYAPTQAETNGNHIAFTFEHATGVIQTVNVYPVAFNPADADDLGLTALTGHTPQTGDSFARLGAPAGASVSADIAAIEAQTDDIGVAGAGLTALATQASVDAIAGFVDTEVAAIITAVAAVQADTDNIQTRLPAALVGGRIAANAEVVGDKTGYTIAAGGITAPSFGLDAIDAAAIKADAGTELADALLDRASAVEGFTVRQLLRLIAAVLLGKASGLDTATAIYRDLADTKDRITATVDANGNRTLVVRDAT